TAYAVNPIVIPNGIEPIGQSELKIHSPRRIVMVGRLSIQKNPLLAIKALSMLKELEWSFEVIGDGPLRGALQALADRYGMGGRVKMRGWLPASEVRQAMLQADILLMTSLQEGLPMVAIEALQCGLAIVGSRIGGMLDVVEDGGNGFLCDLSAEAFSQKLQALLTDSALLNRMRCASREKGKDFDLEKIVTAYESVLQASNSKNR
ncbi:MAG TPA: glycosyltransferase family 4 protein, partial [Terrimicrobiaceae bacterium]